MAVQTIDELRAFHQFLDAKLYEKSVQCSPEEAQTNGGVSILTPRKWMKTSLLSRKLSLT